VTIDGADYASAISGVAMLALVWPKVEAEAKSRLGVSDDTQSKPTTAQPKAKPKAKPTSRPTFPLPGGKTYLARFVPQYDDYDVNVLRISLKHGHHIFLPGPPGCGKTALVLAAAGEGVQRLVGTGGTSRPDFLGQTAWDNATGKPYVPLPGPLKKSVSHVHDDTCPRDADGEIHCGGATFYSDELNAIPIEETTILNDLADKSATKVAWAEFGEIDVSPDFRLIVSINPDIPGLMVSDAIVDRLGRHLPVEPDFNIAREMGVPDPVVDFAIDLAIKKEGGTPMGPLPSMRQLLDFQTDVEVFSERAAWGNLLARCAETNRDLWLDVASRMPSVPSGIEPAILKPIYKQPIAV